MLDALDGRRTERIPTMLFTCQVDYTYKVAGMEMWELSCGGTEEWMKAYRSLIDRHHPDSIMFDGVRHACGPARLIGQDADTWTVYDSCSRSERVLSKLSGHGKEGDGLGWMKEVSTIEEARSRIKPDRLQPNYLQSLRRLIDYAGEDTLVIPSCHNPAYWYAASALGFERTMESMLLEPELFIGICERYQSFERDKYEQLKEAGAEAIFISDAWNSSELISPDMFRKFALPCHRFTVDAIHAAGMKAILWNEGDVRPLLDDEAEVPMDAFGVEQARKGIDISMKDLRRAFGDKRCLLGNLDSETLLIDGDKRAIEQEIRRIIEDAGPGLPFIMTTGAPIPSNVDMETVDAIFEIMGRI
jgi:uroporphyrinogen-III decarboxylase